MGIIKILGAFGNRGVDARTTCIQISENTLIDAGNILEALGENAKDIENIFLTHSHLDHIVDSAFLCDISFETRTKPLKIYALKSVIEELKKSLFNWYIWPDFSKIKLLNDNKKALEFIEISFEEKIKLEDNLFLTPVQANHTVECCGYIIEDNDGALLFTSDTYTNPNIWERINTNKKIKSIIIDISFPSRLSYVAQESKHLTPALLKEELKNLKRDNVKVYINHLKPNYKDEIIQELDNMGIPKNRVLLGGEIIDFCIPKILSKEKVSQIDKIKKLNKIGISLSASNSINEILEMIVTEARGITNADGGTLYLLNEEKRCLDFIVVQTDSLGIKLGGLNPKIDWPSLPLYLEDGSENRAMVAVLCALEGKVINIEDVYKTEEYDFSGTRRFDKNSGFRSKSMLVVPLKNHEKKIIGVLQLINKQDTFGVIPFGSDDEEITLSLASQAAVSLTNTNLIKDLEKLLESALESINFALGKKSPFTANHVRKMVALSKMIALEIDRDEKVFKDKKFSEDEIKQINFAALMHDIGKLATPDYVLDKSTKLEALFDRIELVKTRAWAIQKELEVQFLKGELTKEEFESKKESLESDLKLLETSNQGGEFLEEEIVERIEKLEKNPIVGNLYLITPEEASMLKIRKGTLSDKEREIINDHAKHSLEILNRLPFPEKYKDIPIIAGSHHEKINGKGYPLGLKGDEITFEARILAIADIFEALTSDDRPYKKPNPLSKAMKILYFMAKDGDLDKDLVKFFYESGLYLKFAKEMLKEESIDKVDIRFDW